MNGTNRQGRPHRRWTGDVTEWYKSDPHTVSEQATDRPKWRLVVQLTPVGIGADDDDDAFEVRMDIMHYLRTFIRHQCAFN